MPTAQGTEMGLSVPFGRKVSSTEEPPPWSRTTGNRPTLPRVQPGMMLQLRYRSILARAVVLARQSEVVAVIGHDDIVLTWRRRKG